jgi:hypothetical protein
MKKEEIEVYSHECNSCIVKMPERSFPGVVIQGDSLSILYSSALRLVQELEGKVEEEVFLGALELAESLEGHLDNYMSTLNHHNIELPFPNGKAGSTEPFQKYWSEE